MSCGESRLSLSKIIMYQHLEVLLLEESPHSQGLDKGKSDGTERWVRRSIAILRTIKLYL